MTTQNTVNTTDTQALIKARKQVLQARITSWRKAQNATREMAIEAIKHNKEKPAKWIENDMLNCGLFPSKLTAKGERVPVGYATILKDFAVSLKKGVAPEWDAFHENALFVQACYKQVQIMRAEWKLAEEGEKAIEKRKDGTVDEAPEDNTITEQSIENANDDATVQLARTIPVGELVNTIIEQATTDLDNIIDFDMLKTAYRDTLRKLAVIA